MIIIKHPSQLREFIGLQKAAGRITGFVPTMGALHAGHLELIKVSGMRSNLTVCSIFINPTQFNDPADFKKYPQTLEKDIRLLESSGAGALFLPDVEDVYSQGLSGLEAYDLGYLETILEGRYRPGHFQGVCQVMSRLLMMVQPDLLFMGQKDYQQCLVTNWLLDQLPVAIRLIRCPTVREQDGLAMSSRNLRLTPQQRAVAPELISTLQSAKSLIVSADFAGIRQQAIGRLETAGFRPDYFELADAATLQPPEKEKNQGLVLLVAAFLGEVRLIDNLLI